MSTFLSEKLLWFAHCVGRLIGWKPPPRPPSDQADAFQAARCELQNAVDSTRQAGLASRQATAATIKAQRVLRRGLDRVILETASEAEQYFGSERRR